MSLSQYIARKGPVYYAVQREEQRRARAAKEAAGIAEAAEAVAREAAMAAAKAEEERLAAEAEANKVNGPLPPAIVILQRVVADHFGVTREAMRAPGRKIANVEARRIAMYLTMKVRGLTTTKTGVLFGGRDHSTVIHADRTVCARIASDSAYAAEVSAIEAKVRAAIGGGLTIG